MTGKPKSGCVSAASRVSHVVVFHSWTCPLGRVDHLTLLLRMQPPVILEYEPTQLKLDTPPTRIEHCPPSSVAEDPINKTTPLCPELELAVETEDNVQESTYNGPAFPTDFGERHVLLRICPFS
jgi:hypothetical protein